MIMRTAYVSILFSEDFLPGILVLNYSLKIVHARSPLLVLVTPNISGQTLAFLGQLNIDTQLVALIDNPGDSYRFERFKFMYSKLNIFGLTQFDKIVYIDSDMLVCNNIDQLFDRPHMSAVNTAGWLPDYQDWKQFNAGLLVIEPRRELFADMMQQLAHLPSEDGSDQGFLHSYYPDWPQQSQLHLCQGYNMYVGFLSQYKRLHGYRFAPQAGPAEERIFRGLHYWGPDKPWHASPGDSFPEDIRLANRYWHTLYQRYAREFPADLLEYLRAGEVVSGSVYPK